MADEYRNISEVLSGRYGENGKTIKTKQDDTRGYRSAINRYALFSYKGINYDNEPAPVTDKAFTQNSNQKNPTAANVINGFSNQFGAMEYDWADFLYAAKYGELPNNYLITLRRFPTPCSDNIYNQDLQSQPDLARAVTWWGSGTDNSLKDILGFDFGLNFAEMESEVQVLHSQRLGFGLSSSLLGRNVARDEALYGVLKGSTNAYHRNDKAWKGEVDVMDYYPNFVYGPVNVINKMMRRDRGLFFNHEIKINVDYELKSLGGINPKAALLDVFANILTLGYNNAPFFGGGRRYKSDPRRAHLLGDSELLKSGDYGGYLSSVGDDLLGSVQNLFSDEDSESFGTGDIIQGFKRLGGGITQSIFGSALNKSGVRPAYQAIHALLTGEPTGDWHITVGNPFNPIAMMGNLILTGTNIEWDDVLGADDFPRKVRATFTLKPARPRDKTDIESAFNAGKGRIYQSPANGVDVLNLDGLEKPVYGKILPNNNKKTGKEIRNSYRDAEFAEASVEQETGVDAESIVSNTQLNSKRFAKWTTVNANSVRNTNKWFSGA